VTGGAAKSQRVAVLLLEQFAMMSFACTVEPLREANWVMGRQAYDWRVYSPDGGPVRASNGLSINVHGSIENVTDCSLVLVCSSFDPHKYASGRVLTWLRRAAQRGAMVGGVETGTWVLARAGLLDGYRATIHWENRDGVLEEFPAVLLTNNIFELDRRRCTASGAAAAMDMMLHLIRLQHGAAVANNISEEFIYNRIRGGAVPQRISSAERFTFNNRKLRRVVDLLDSQLERRINLPELATSVELSERQLQRMFQKHLKTSPQAYHRNLRLRRARNLLRQTELSIVEIALATGFNSASDFSRCYRREFGCAPVTDRTVFYAPDSL
jgi:transcriptional regulator GlxA family with amidase domain